MPIHSKRPQKSAVVKSSDIIGVNVKNTKNEKLGYVSEIVLDKVNANIRYLVVACHATTGMKDKFLAVPWTALKYHVESESYILDLHREKFKTAPCFDKADWPNLADIKLGEIVFSYYGSKPNWL